MIDIHKSMLNDKLESIYKDVTSNLAVEKCHQISSNSLTTQEYATLFADFAGSTLLIDKYDSTFSTWLLKSYLSCVSTLIQQHGGMITAFEGDGLMAVFEGDNKESKAVKCSFNIQWAINNIIQPKIDVLFPEYKYKIYQVVGIDSSELTPIKTDVWEHYDTYWLGRSANYSANLTCINNPCYSTYITASIFDNLSNDLKGNSNNVIWGEMEDSVIDTKVFRTNRAIY